MNLPQHVYHLAEAANWPSIEKHGLLPAAELIARAGLSGADRERLERSQRPEPMLLPDGVEIRDQRPMPASALQSCLVGLDPADWYALVNVRVFFWLDPARLNRQRAAYGSRPQVVLTLDTVGLVADYGDRAAVSPINSGNARRRPARRGAATFVPYTEWVRSGWASEAVALGIRERRRSHPPTELTVMGAIPNAMQYVTAISRLAAGERFRES
ncbi:hypothetical protein AB0395_46725 [Streptosporangium sp. NPDC051023]|uniref:DUF7002 family protein n=1 Tax=Streptosporangium sp. NPDC051023 TaxID=3155410 RepID=UPI00344D3700